jgi:hypothetical protein
MAAQPLAIEFLERHPLREFEVGTRKFVPLIITNLEVDYDDGLWSVSLSPLDAVGCSQDFLEARQRLFEYIRHSALTVQSIIFFTSRTE